MVFFIYEFILFYLIIETIVITRRTTGGQKSDFELNMSHNN